MSKQIFTIMKLEDKDYLQLHKQFPNITEQDLHDSLGFTDREAGEIYVRKTGIKDIDNETILHEAQELFSETSPHEKDGIRFGWFKKAFGFSSQPVMNVALPIAAGILGGPLGVLGAGALSGLTSAVTQKLNTGSINPVGVGLSALGGGLTGGAMAKGVAASKAVGGSYLGQVNSGVQGALGITSGADKLLKAQNIGMEGVTSELTKSGIKGYTDIAGNLGPKITPTSPGVSAGIGATIGSALGNISNVSGVQTPATVPAGAGLNTVTAPVATAVPKTFMETAKAAVTNPTNILGATSLVGSMATPAPQFEMPSGVEDIRKKLLAGEGLTDLGKQAQTELANILSSEPSQINAPANDAYYADTNRRIDLQYEQAKNQLDAVYNNAGMLGSGEYLDQVRRLTQAQADAKDAFMQSENQRRFEYGANQKYQAIQTALGVDQNVMNDLVGLTGLDVQTAAMMYGAQAADITAIRSALGTLGTEMILRGTTGTGKQPTVSVNLGK